MSAGARNMRYISGIDGLRALSVAAVFLYHAGAGWMPGGFLGVEVFFVISGYLVTSLILTEWDRTGDLELRRFWQRRARRLLPAGVAVVVGVLAWAAAVHPGEVARLRDDAIASIVAVSNWHQIFAGESYFAALERPPALRHYWSLAVEWQFYLLWPVVALGALRFGGRPALLAAAIAGAVLSALLLGAMFVPGQDPSRIYYGTDTRLTGLLTGAALAVLLRMVPLAASGRAGAVALELVAAVALVALAAWTATVGEYDAWLYQGGLAAVAAVTAVVLAAISHPDGRAVPRLLSLPALRWLGTRSYSIYLVHWPIIVFTQPGTDVPLDGATLVVFQGAITLALAEASYLWIEQPFRSVPALHARVAQWLRDGLSRRLGTTPQAASLFGAAGLTLLGAATIWTPGASTEPYVPAVRTVVTAIPTATTPTPAVSPTAPASGYTPTVEGAATPPTVEIPVPVTATPTAIPATPAPTPSPDTPMSAPTQTAEPSPAAPMASVSALGDSVMLGAVSQMAQAFGAVAIDAAVGRQVSAGIDVLRQWRDSGTLGAVVVIHLGNNGTFTAAQFDELMSTAGADRTVVFLTVRVSRPWEGPNNEVIRAGIARYSNARLADWHASSAGADGWFAGDGIHLTGHGASAYAALLASVAPAK